MSFSVGSQGNIQEMNDESQSENDRQSEDSLAKRFEGEQQVNNEETNVCSNKFCKMYKPSKYNLTHQSNIQNLCQECIQQYQKQSYCLYCKQIYFDGTDDGKQWIMCDGCQRWVHTECADFYPTSKTNQSFNCLKCKKIDINLNLNRTGRASNRNPTKIPERRKAQQCNLNNYGFFWQLSPAQLAEDVQKLKQFIK